MSQKPQYTIAGKQSIAQTQDLRVTVMTLNPGQEIPRHSHTQVKDTTFCLKGQVEVSLGQPEETLILNQGEWIEIAPGRAHRVRCLGEAQCQTLLVQGVGEYDFVAD